MRGAASPASRLTERLLVEILAEAHRYAPGLEPDVPTRVEAGLSRTRRLAAVARDRSRDVVERAAARAGFTRRHFDPGLAGERLGAMLELADGFAATHDMLADEPSRQALVNLLKLRVLGPYHAPLPLTPMMFREKQAHADRELRLEHGTFDVSDPWFTPLSRYRVPVEGGSPVTLHGHSVDMASVFLLNQYSYLRPPARVAAAPGDVVVDAGGCWGDTALYFASRVGPAGKVYTFEFDPENLEVMRANLELNPELASRIEVVERPLWGHSGEMLGFIGGGRMTRVVAPEEADRLVETITLDDFVEQAGLARVDFVKMDVEGAESSVLSGARSTLARDTPKLAIAAYHEHDDLVRLPAAIASVVPGYRFYLDTFSPLEEETVLFATARPDAT